ncbi:MAG: hypothetical protein U0930_07205 [Pirellulales bacterium]
MKQLIAWLAINLHWKALKEQLKQRGKPGSVASGSCQSLGQKVVLGNGKIEENEEVAA